MNRFTIIRYDNMAYIDGLAIIVDCSMLPVGLHAVQWDDESKTGWIEWVDGGFGGARPNSLLDAEAFDVMFKPYVDAWYAEKQKVDAAIAAAAAPKAATPSKPPASPTGITVIAD